ncbi:hypothetical protein QJ856_gp1185 [Tupanvirus deep ocean]|uniref:Uncharacterized protein n=2 Tax=Tupanvirus TaxID=2094720 RepID=A0AC62A765_9VIRU|nr:hypothetical protein QJ856_gp1185 [Tupanvirus deep ocean]QKU33576.1 hypothetical protein [Tupanvirus deep ocean]
MPVNEKMLLYSLANTFSTTLGVDICDDTKAYLKSKSKAFAKLDVEEKMYYAKYSIQLAKCLMDYLDDISLFEINTDADSEIVHDFKLTWSDDNIAHVCMSHISINIKDIIPEKLMKICKYKGNTNICKYYLQEYKKLNEKGYKKIQNKSKYSELTDKTKNTAILEPVCNLVLNTLSKKRKCAVNLYNHLFGETDRIVFKLYKNRFTMYDFGVELDDVESFRMKLNPGNEILLTFNNETKFVLTLQTNATDIKEHLSLKFHTNFKNMDELFAVKSSSV